jgi:3'-phosphoadenosine 5'-phosphosulfate sulfotransferase (PAPS reductase)/FAD synthetase
VNRLDELIEESHWILDEAVEEHVTADGRSLAATCVLFSGGNDSTVLAHLFRLRADYAVHANTGIGIEQTRVYVRKMCAHWELPLLEEHPPPGSTYRELVLDRGFPGPAMHWKMYQRLKERALRQVVRYVVTNPRQQRVVFLAGRRRDESKRRMNVPQSGREGTVVWASPLVDWTNADLQEYRERYMPDIPRNETADLLHMSGECLCGAFAKAEELEEIAFWYPEVAEEIHALEHEVRAAGIPEPRCRWGWGNRTTDEVGLEAVKSGPMCSSCDARLADIL